MLTYDNLEVSYGGCAVVRGVSFEVKEGEVFGIVGESGSGKSTILRATLGILGSSGAVTGGQIRYEASSLGSLGESNLEVSNLGTSNLCELSPDAMREIRGAEIGMIFQDCLSALSPIRTVESQLWEACCAHEGLPYGREELFERAYVLLEKLSVDQPERVLRSYPFELSGGLGQRVGIAMAMLLEPKVILADEPTSALDVISQRQVLDALRRLCDERGVTIVFVSHNIAAVRAIADSVLVLKDGVVEEAGDTQDVLSNPQTPYTKKLLSSVVSLKGESAYE